MARKGKKPKLLFILENYPPHYGGVEVLFQNTCEGMAARGHDVELITHRVKKSKKRELRNGVKIRRVPTLGSRYLFTLVAPFFALGKAQRADLIHTTIFSAAPAAWLVAKLTRKPVILHVHETWIGRWREYTSMPRWKATLHDVLERFIYLLRYDYYLCISESTARNLREVLPEKLHDRVKTELIGFDYTAWRRADYEKRAREVRKELGLSRNGRGKNGKKFVVLGYGRPGPSKGFEYLVRAFPKVKRAVKNAHLVLILSNDKAYRSERQKLLDLIEELKIKNTTTVLTPRPYKELPAYVAAADCVAVPSLAEGFGYTTVEANAIGTPVVASDTTSIPEVVSGAHVLVPPRDPAAMAEGIIKVSKKQYKQTRPKRFLWSKTLDRFEEAYKRVLKRRQS